MKKEFLNQAISHIDPDLIMEADAVRQSHPSRPYRRPLLIVAAAAALVLAMITAIRMTRQPQVIHTPSVTDEPVIAQPATEEPVKAPETLRLYRSPHQPNGFGLFVYDEESIAMNLAVSPYQSGMEVRELPVYHNDMIRFDQDQYAVRTVKGDETLDALLAEQTERFDEQVISVIEESGYREARLENGIVVTVSTSFIRISFPEGIWPVPADMDQESIISALDQLYELYFKNTGMKNPVYELNRSCGMVTSYTPRVYEKTGDLDKDLFHRFFCALVESYGDTLLSPSGSILFEHLPQDYTYLEDYPLEDIDKAFASLLERNPNLKEKAYEIIAEDMEYDECAEYLIPFYVYYVKDSQGHIVRLQTPAIEEQYFTFADNGRWLRETQW
ncbi:MAG: hypothetical protein IKD69_08230 [Solobacterium sp.]|nr:hypothetical protein [Solobacterium sp.]